ncbi:MAG: TetR/AcrR family transcriptional regulator [Pseudomonadota bacterium]
MARPREFDEASVIEAIKDVFWNKGYADTSYADLIAASGLHKGSLYAAFGDKRALYLRALQSYDEHEVAGAVALLCGGDGPRMTGPKRIEKLLNAVIDAVVVNNDRRGCLLCNASVDQAPHNKGVEDFVSSGLERMQRAFETALASDKKGAALKEAASLCNAAYFGMRVMAKSGAPISMMKQARNGALKSI